VALVSTSAPALAESQSWNVTEESASGVKSVQGTWAVTVDGDKLSGTADMQYVDGAPFAYSFAGAKSGAVYTVTLEGRSDNKKGCVWTGSAPAGGDAKSFRLVGKVVCEGAPGFTIRASRM
jgi:hypothetical protein